MNKLLPLLIISIIFFAGCTTPKDDTNTSEELISELPGVAYVVFPEEAFSSKQPIKILKTVSKETESDFKTTTEIFSPTSQLPYQIRINTGNKPPLADSDVVINVPESLLGEDYELQVFAQIFQDGGEDFLDSFEIVDSYFSSSDNVLDATIPKEAFTNTRTQDRSFEAILMVATTPTDQEDVFDLESETADIDIYSDVSFDDISLQESACEAAYIDSPLDGDLRVISRFDGRTHFGTDFAAAEGDDVLAAADGKILRIGFDERSVKNANARQKALNLKKVGWGRYIIIEHDDGSKTLYAHLIKDSPASLDLEEGMRVEKGEVIGQADTTGGATGSHLHFEYVPKGNPYKKANKIDPEPCIAKGFNLDVSLLGEGFGTVVSDPEGIFCSIDCSKSYTEGEIVVLTAEPLEGHKFFGWAGDCEGTGDCFLTMDSDKEVAAQFEYETFTDDTITPDDGRDTNSGTQGQASVSIDSQACNYQGPYGLTFSDYGVELGGQATGPEGAIIVFRQNLFATNTNQMTCGSWTPLGTHDEGCTRVEGQPESTSWTWSFGITAEGRNFQYSPEAWITDSSNYILATAAAQLTCN